MRLFLEIARTGFSALCLHPVRSGVTICVVMSILVPYLAGVGLSHGLRDVGEDSLRFGSDLTVTGTRFGRAVPIPLSAVDAIRRLEGVIEVVPRIVGALALGKNREPAVLVGLPRGRLPKDVSWVQGQFSEFSTLNEFIVGTQLATRLSLEIGSIIPPFYRSAKGERLSKVVGVLSPEAPLWQANLMLTTLETASQVFDQPDQVTCLLVSCRPGYSDQIKTAILRMPALDSAQGTIRYRVASKHELASLLPSGWLHREGIFHLHFVLAFAAAILAVLVTSGAGLSERRREIGILKATGWQTDEILLRGVVESVLLCLVAASASIVVAFVWLKWLNGLWIASVFLSGVDAVPGFKIPFRLVPVPVLLAFVISAIVVLSGTLYPTWRAAIVPPRDAMR
ncbi:MAG: FtsX-like permease family protein [Planctomycetes bacterium]|nr:FtsX-like permease family protein [Planctomycetota bacterium]